MQQLPKRPLGSSGFDVSVMALGSWRTFERIPRDQGVEIMVAARTAGISFLDDARYDDEYGDAPIPTGYSEVVFGELFRAAGWDRDEVVVSNKLWWEHWPDESAAEEVEGSLHRMGFDHLDLIYAMPPPAAMAMEALVEDVAGLLESGRARAWGTGMWSATQHREALAVCAREGIAGPVAAQMANSLVDHHAAGDPEMRAVLGEGDIGLVASFVLAGGTLTGKYSSGGTGRAADDDRGPTARGKELAGRVVDVARDWGVPPSHVAFAFAFGHPNLASVLFGSRSADQLRENVAAWATFEELDDDRRATLADLARVDGER